MPTASPGISMRVPERGRVARALPFLAAVPVMVHAAQVVTLERTDPRLYGYQLGDVITELVEIRLQPGYALDPQSLPRAGKRAGWFLVRSAGTQSQPAPGGGTRIQLKIEMQLTNSPTAPRSLTIPEVALRFKGPDTITENVPSLTIDAVPLGTGDVRTGMPDVRPPHPALLMSSTEATRRLRWIGLLAAPVALWLLAALLLRWLRPRSLQPFAQAQRELRGLLRAAGTVEGARTAVQRLHRAFDQAAGQRLFGAGVPAFCHRMGADARLEERTVAFFSASQALFFDTAGASVPAGLAGELNELCRAWCRFEGRHP